MAILISIKPEYVEKILNGEKTLEIRKSIPKCELPCKVYIYETKGKILIGEHFERSKSKENLYFGGKAKYITKKDYYFGKGKVVAEFTLKNIEEFELCSDLWKFSDEIENRIERIQKQSCVPYVRLVGYLNRKTGYAWHIDNLTIYDKPKELSEFYKKCKYCNNEKLFICANNFSECDKITKIKRPPQSWCYVEDIGEEL